VASSAGAPVGLILVLVIGGAVLLMGLGALGGAAWYLLRSAPAAVAPAAAPPAPVPTPAPLPGDQPADPQPVVQAGPPWVVLSNFQ
jgi:hypothetical protein